jgi:hypothetical protein
MSTPALVSIEEYLRTSYSDGDREYVDGRIVDRNIGAVPHGSLQTEVLIYGSAQEFDSLAEKSVSQGRLFG